MGEEIGNKIDNIILMGAGWTNPSEEEIAELSDFYADEAHKGIFKGMTKEKATNGLRAMRERLKDVSAESFPNQARIVGVQAAKDEQTDEKREIFSLMPKLEGIERQGMIFLKDFEAHLASSDSDFMKEKRIGGREPERHDYNMDEVRGWIKKIIEKSKK